MCLFRYFDELKLTAGFISGSRRFPASVLVEIIAKAEKFIPGLGCLSKLYLLVINTHLLSICAVSGSELSAGY